MFDAFLIWIMAPWTVTDVADISPSIVCRDCSWAITGEIPIAKNAIVHISIRFIISNAFYVYGNNKFLKVDNLHIYPFQLQI